MTRAHEAAVGASLRGAALASSGMLLVMCGQAAHAGQLPASAFQAYNPSSASTITPGAGALYSVGVDSIMPTQASEGYAEVGKKTAGFDLLTPAQLQANLLTSIEPVVIGPGGQLYLTDGHHTFTALEESTYGASNPTVYVDVIANYATLTTAQFYATMQANNFLLPLNDGVPQTVTATGAPLPTSLTALTNDPYRGLEYSILKNKSSTLFPTAANITGAIGASTPGLDKMTGYYLDFFEAAAYRAANGGLGLPTISPGDIALATQWNLNPASVTTLPNVAGTVTAAQLPGFILAQNVSEAAGITNATLATGAIDGNGGFTGLTTVNLGTAASPITVGVPNVGLIMQLGNDKGYAVTLNGANSYTGGTSILAGNLIVQSDASLGATTSAAATIDPTKVLISVQAANGIVFNSLDEGNATLMLGLASGGTFSTARPIAVGGETATINVNGNVATLTGQLVSLGTAGVGIGNATGYSDLTIDDLSAADNGQLILSTASPNFHGNIVIGNSGTPTVTVMNDAALGNTTGAATTIGQVDLNGGTLQTGASFAAPERNLFLGGGSNIDVDGFTTSWGMLTDVQRTLDIINSSKTAAGAISFDSLTVGAASTLQLAGGTRGETVTLTNGIVRPAQDTLILQPTSSTSLGTTEKLISTSTVPLTDGIAPAWIVTNNGVSKSAGPYDFVTYGANGFVNATYGSTTLTAATGNSTVALAAKTTAAGNVAAYALNTEGKAITLGSNTLTLGNGTDPAGLVLASGSAISGGTIAFRGSEGVIWLSGSNPTISSTISGSKGLTFSGSGGVTISQAAAVQGLVTVDAGTLTLATANVFASDTAGLLLDDTKSKPAAATLALTANNAFTTLNTVGSNSGITLSNGAALTLGDSTNNLGSTVSATIKESGAATAGALTVAGSGLFDFTGGSKSFNLVSGSTIVANDSAQLRVAASDFVNSGIGVVLNGSSQLQFAQNGGGLFANTVSGTGALHLIGGTLKITGTANSYTGGTIVETGSTLDVTTANLPVNSPNVTAAGGLVLFDQATDGSYAGVISDGLEMGVGPMLSGSLDKDDSSGANAGNVTLAQGQRFTGRTVIEAGTLTLGAVDTLATSSGIDLGRVGGGAVATLALDANNRIQGLSSEAGNTTSVQLGANALTIDTAAGTVSSFAGTIDGAGSVIVAGAGTETFGGANGYTGGTTLAGGALALTGTGTLGAPTGTLAVTGGTLDLGGSTQTTGAMTIAGGTIQNGALASTSYAAQGGTVSAMLTGTGSLTAASGVTTLSGANSYSGGTTVAGGTLAIAGAGTLGAAGSALAVTGGTLDLGGSTQNSGIVTLTGGSIQNGTLDATAYDVQSGTIDAVLGGTGGLTKTGTGTVVLGTANSYTGATDIQAGTLQLGVDNALSSSTALTVENGATLDLAAHSDTVGSFTLYGTLTGGGLLTANSTNLYGGMLGMGLTGATVNQVSGTTLVTGTVSAANLAITGGTLQLGTSDRIGDGTAVTVSPGATLDLQGHSDTVSSLTLAGTLAGTGTLTAATYALDAATVNANLGTGTLTNTGGVSALNGSAAAGTVDVAGGTLALGGENRLASTAALTVAAGATLDIGAYSNTVGTAVLDGTLAGTGTLTAANYSLDAAAVNANLGTGTLTNFGGTSIINGTADATTVSVAGGTLALGASNRLADAAALTVFAGATFDVGAYSDTVGAAAINGTLAGTGTLTAASYSLNGAVVNANIGAGTLTNSGGVSTLNGVAAAKTVAIDAGTLQLGASERLADDATLTVASGARFNLAGYSQSIASLNGAGTVALGAGTLTDGGTGAVSDFTGTLSGTGSFIKMGSGALTLTGTQSLTGLIDLDGGTTSFTGSTAGNVRINGGTLVGNASVAGNLALVSGTLSPGTAPGAVDTLTVGSLTVSGGTLAIDAAGSAGSFASDTIKVAGAATLTGGTVTVSATEPLANYRMTQDYVLVQAGSLTGTFANAAGFTQTSNDAGLYYRLRYDLVPDEVLIELRKQVDFTQSLAAGASANQYAVARALTGGALTGSDAYVDAVSRIANLTPAEQAAAFDALSGESVANITTAAIEASNRFIDMLRDRISMGGGSSANPDGLLAGLFGHSNLFQQERVGGTRQTPSMGLTGDGAGGSGAPHADLWVQGFGAAGTIDGQTGTAKMVDDSTGIAVGVDAQVGALRLGGAFAADHLDTELRARASKSNGTIHQGAVYVAYDDGHAYANAIGSYFDGRQASARNVIVGSSPIGVASARPDLNGWSGAGTAGYRIVFGNDVRLTPQVDGSFTRVERDAFSESGAGVFSLDVAEDKRTTYTVGGELRLSKPFALGGGTVEPYVSGGVVFNLGDRDAISAMQFEGAPSGTGAFIVDGVRLPREAARVSGGFQVQATQRVAFGVGAEALLADRQHQGAINMRIKMGF